MSGEYFYKKGIALGVQDIKTDSIIFFYNDEQISVPTYNILKYPAKAHYNGCNYEAKIEDVRKAAKEP